MTARKRFLLLTLTLACVALLAGCIGSDGSVSDHSAAGLDSYSASAESEERADSSATEMSDEADTSATAETLDSSEPYLEVETENLENQKDTLVSLGEMEDQGEDDEDDTMTEEEALEALDEQYSAFTDADTSLPIIP
ncbi:MAG: hypothetical protein LUE29_06325 [Lachnospiraceae bacterium]|nr:hypothetical protein [Lachnospiraceae bacterium]